MNCFKLEDLPTKPTQHAEASVDRMIERGLSQNFKWFSDGKCDVPSENIDGKMYNAFLTCECMYTTHGNMCKHIIFAQKMVVKSGIDLMHIRQHSEVIIEAGSHVKERSHVTVYADDGHVGVVSNGQCTCRTNSLGETCICIIVQSCLQKDAGETEEEKILSNCFLPWQGQWINLWKKW